MLVHKLGKFVVFVILNCELITVWVKKGASLRWPKQGCEHSICFIWTHVSWLGFVVHFFVFITAAAFESGEQVSTIYAAEVAAMLVSGSEVSVCVCMCVEGDKRGLDVCLCEYVFVCVFACTFCVCVCVCVCICFVCVCVGNGCVCVCVCVCDTKSQERERACLSICVNVCVHECVCVCVCVCMCREKERERVCVCVCACVLVCVCSACPIHMQVTPHNFVDKLCSWTFFFNKIF